MSKVIVHKVLSATLKLTECQDGWWLYDTTRSMNLSMKAKSPENAFIEALTYYQGRLQEVEQDYKTLKNAVDRFVDPFIEEAKNEW